MLTSRLAITKRRAPASRTALAIAAVALPVTLAGACADKTPAELVRASGHVEATEVQVAAEVGGRLLDLKVNEGDRIAAGDRVATLDTADVELAVRRAQAERQQADAQLRLLQAGARPEDIRQAEALAAGSDAARAAAEAELQAAETDFRRFDALLRTNAGSQKQRDEAATRRDVARERLTGAEEQRRAAREALARLRAGARSQEIAAAQARVAAVDAQLAALQKNIADATVRSPASGVVTAKLVEEGEIVAPRTPLLVITNIDQAWAEVFIDEPSVPRLRLGQTATIFTDAGGPGIPGRITFVSSKAEFTPRNVQTTEERSKLVYRIKITTDNRQGLLKQGMPIEAEIPLGTDNAKPRS